MSKLYVLLIILSYFSNFASYAQQIQLIYPADNQFVDAASAFYIQWTGPSSNQVKIEYRLGGNTSWQQALGFGYGNTWHWFLPDTQNVECWIKITETADTANYDQNDFPFILYKTETNFIAVNEIFMYLKNDGIGSHNPFTDASGLYWPIGSNYQNSASFYDGLWWSCSINGELRANGSYFDRSGVRPGIIQAGGSASNPADSTYKIWKINKEWESLPPGSERDGYEFNFNNWPAEIGAPWQDVNGDGVFTRGIDLPMFLGDETLWYVSNDLDTAKCLAVFGSLPIGLEFQVTTWGYKSELLKDVVFKKYLIINKGNQTAEDLILGFWSDDDLGDANDDYPGCDSALNMGFVFNGDDDDQRFYGTPPPAIGRMIIQAPIVPALPSDSAMFKNGWHWGYKNLRMSAYSPGFKNWSNLPQDPEIGTYNSAQEVYNLLKGLLNNGDSLINPLSGIGTIYPLEGDPESGIGWYCGTGWPNGPASGDRRSLIASGPFNLTPGDTNEIVIAVFLQKGINNLNSVTKLKQYAAVLQNWYFNNFVTDEETTDFVIPVEFLLSQNYPNPFNPTTKIKYSIPNVISTDLSTNAGKAGGRNLKVVLKVYDILGNEVSTLVNEEKPAGSYEVEFDGSKLSSGVYFYQLKSQDFIQTKKMILMK